MKTPGIGSKKKKFQSFIGRGLKKIKSPVQKMEEQKLNKKLKNIKNYLGSFAVDELHLIKFFTYPSFAIINFDRRQESGSHWFAIAIYSNDLYICDSLGGMLPIKNMPQSLINFLNIISVRRHIHVTKRLQPINSSLCGSYCIFFIREMSKSNSFSEFLSHFSTDLCKNDKIIKILSKQK